MMKPVFILRWSVCAVLCGAALAPAMAAPRLERAVAINLVGESEYVERDKSDWRGTKKGLTIWEGASLRTATNSIIDFAISTKGTFRVTQKTIVRVEQMRQEFKGLPSKDKEPSTLTSLDLERGKVSVRAALQTTNSEFAVTTRTCLIESRGYGAFSVWLINDRACVRAIERTAVINIRGKADPIVLQAGQQLCVTCDPRTNEATDMKITTPPDPDPDPPIDPPPPPTPPPPDPPPPPYEISPTQP